MHISLLTYSLTHLLTVFILGLCLGSFANVLIYRIPRNLSIFKPRSFCPKCKNPIKWYHNIPVISFILLFGKCKYCGSKISIQYPVVETLTAILLTCLWAKSKDKTFFVIYSVFVFYLIVISFIDLEHKIIPDVLSFSLIIIGMLLSPFNSYISDRLTTRILYSISGLFIGLTIFFLISYLGKKIFKKEALGEGDIKFALGLGVFLGPYKFFLSLFIGSLAGTFLSLVLIYILKKKTWGEYLPFGPFLSFGALISLFV